MSRLHSGCRCPFRPKHGVLTQPARGRGCVVCPRLCDSPRLTGDVSLGVGTFPVQRSRFAALVGPGARCGPASPRYGRGRRSRHAANRRMTNRTRLQRRSPRLAHFSGRKGAACPAHLDRASRSRCQASVSSHRGWVATRRKRSNGVRPRAVRASPSAPASRSTVIAFALRFAAALCSGVMPRLSRASIFAPAAIKASTVAALPLDAASVLFFSCHFSFAFRRFLRK